MCTTDFEEPKVDNISILNGKKKPIVKQCVLYCLILAVCLFILYFLLSAVVEERKKLRKQREEELKTPTMESISAPTTPPAAYIACLQRWSHDKRDLKSMPTFSPEAYRPDAVVDITSESPFLSIGGLRSLKKTDCRIYSMLER
jgi:hypothetical protein